MAKPLDYARKNPEPKRMRDWKIDFPAAIVVIPSGFVIIFSVTALIWPISSRETVPAAFFAVIGTGALLLEIGCMFRIAATAIPIVIGALYGAISIVGNFARQPFASKAEFIIAGVAMIWLLIVIVGHVRWFLILRSEKRTRTLRNRGSPPPVL
jgi:hypothetical protein